jgi:hypothetical protein
MSSLWMPCRHKLGIENFQFSIFTPFLRRISAHVKFVDAMQAQTWD